MEESTKQMPMRRKDTIKGPPLRILCLDGGGVRGYSMLIILQELMYRTYVEAEGTAPRRDQIPKPCDHFDLIAGSGTGGLIALMLGRLRMDIETCKNLFPRMTKYVFETDKTFAGIPYRSTLFKASRLEDAIRQCVREHTISESEGNDGSPAPMSAASTLASPSLLNVTAGAPTRRLSRTYSGRRPSSQGINSPSSPTSVRSESFAYNGSRWGNPDALLYDKRDNRTKTALTAYFKGTPRHSPPTLLRSYDSRKEPAPEANCTIWEAGRATSAMLHHFKPIQIGQQLFLDEGVGKFNPSPLILDEAVINEWPGRELGVFVSIGTGRRPARQSNVKQEWWEDVFADFAEARKNLIAKIEGCETTHQYMLKEHLAKRNVPKENYCRLNVEAGVGEYGMNEWTRLTEISTNTRIYLAKSEVQRMTHDAAVKMAKIHRTHQRNKAHDAAIAAAEEAEMDPAMRPLPPVPRPVPPIPTKHPAHSQTSLNPPSKHPHSKQPVYELPAAFELPAEPVSNSRPPSQQKPAPRLPNSILSQVDSRISVELPTDRTGSFANSPRTSIDKFGPESGPPLPPKTPIPHAARPVNRVNANNDNDSRENVIISMPSPTQGASRPIGTIPAGTNKWKLPYPDDRPPPPVNKHRKPTSHARS